MRHRLLILGALVFLFASFRSGSTQEGVSAEDGDAKLYSQVIRAEMKAGGLDQHDTVCLAVAHYSDPSKALLKALKSDGLTVKKPHKCLFRGYEIRVEQPAPDLIRVQLVDVRYENIDLGVILRDGLYAIEKDAKGR